MNKANALRASLFAAATVAILFNAWYFGSRNNANNGRSTADIPGLPKYEYVPRVIPEKGWRPFDAGTTVKGNPEKTIAQMKLLHRDLLVYKKKHGAFPKTETDLFFDVRGNMALYGYKSKEEVQARFSNKDVGLSDEYHNFPDWDKYSPYMLPKLRPDGSSPDSLKASGTRDVLAYTDIYYHHNSTLMPNYKWKDHAIGFYLVLWDNGEISKIAWDKVRYAYPKIAHAPDVCFPGQAGVPATTYTNIERDAKILPLRPDGTNPNTVAKK